MHVCTREKKKKTTTMLSCDFRWDLKRAREEYTRIWQRRLRPQKKNSFFTLTVSFLFISQRKTNLQKFLSPLAKKARIYPIFLCPSFLPKRDTRLASQQKNKNNKKKKKTPIEFTTLLRCSTKCHTLLYYRNLSIAFLGTSRHDLLSGYCSIKPKSHKKKTFFFLQYTKFPPRKKKKNIFPSSPPPPNREIWDKK